MYKLILWHIEFSDRYTSTARGVVGDPEDRRTGGAPTKTTLLFGDSDAAEVRELADALATVAEYLEGASSRYARL